MSTNILSEKDQKANQYSEHTPLPWRGHDMKSNVIVKNDASGFGHAIIECQAPSNVYDPHGIEANSTRDFVNRAARVYYQGEALRKAAAAFWSDTDTRNEDEKHSALLAAIVEYDNA